MLRTG
jgi:hypothetical protein